MVVEESNVLCTILCISLVYYCRNAHVARFCCTRLKIICNNDAICFKLTLLLKLNRKLTGMVIIINNNKPIVL